MIGTIKEGNWSEQKSKLKGMFLELTDGNLLSAEETRDQIIIKLQKELDMTKEDIETFIANM